MFKPVDNPSALKALTEDPALAQEFSYQARWQQEEEALNAYEDIALHDQAPVPMAEEAWERERSRMQAERDSNEETLDRYA